MRETFKYFSIRKQQAVLKTNAHSFKDMSIKTTCVQLHNNHMWSQDSQGLGETQFTYRRNPGEELKETDRQTKIGNERRRREKGERE